jgi:hypothetical protein
LLKLKDGKSGNVIVDNPLPSSLASVLLTDAAIQDLLATNEFHISLNTKYELAITHIPQPEPALEEAVAEAEA